MMDGRFCVRASTNTSFTYEFRDGVNYDRSINARRQ